MWKRKLRVRTGRAGGRDEFEREMYKWMQHHTAACKERKEMRGRLKEIAEIIPTSTAHNQNSLQYIYKNTLDAIHRLATEGER